MTEVAIVLGIIGLILGGIWTAVGYSYRKVYVNQVLTQISTIVANARAYYSGQSVSYATLNAAKLAAGQGALQTNPSVAPTGVTPTPPTDLCYYSAIMALSTVNVFPSDMITNVGGNNVANHPWASASNCGGKAGTVQVGLACSAAGAACNTSGPVQLVVRYTAIPDQETCVTLITQNSTPGPDTGLTKVSVNGNVVGTSAASTLPINTTQALGAAACTAAGAPYTIDWFYNLGG